MSVRATMIRMARAEAIELARGAPFGPGQLEAWVRESIDRIELEIGAVEIVAREHPATFERRVFARGSDVFGLIGDMRAVARGQEVG